MSRCWRTLVGLIGSWGIVLCIWLVAETALAEPSAKELQTHWQQIHPVAIRNLLSQTLRESRDGEDEAQAKDIKQRQQPDRVAIPPDIQRIMARGKLIVAILSQENSPFFMTDSTQNLTGLDVKLAQSLAEQLGVKLEFNRTAKTFDTVVQTVYDLKADLAISKLSRTLRRAKSVRFSQPYLKMRQGLLVNRLQMTQQMNGRTITEAIRDLHGKIGVIHDSSYVGFTRIKFPQAEVVEFPSWSDAIAAVIRGDVLATYRDELEVKKVVLSQPDTALTLQTIALTDTEDSIAIALPWDSQHLLAFVNQYLEISKINYSADSLLQAYPVTPITSSDQNRVR